MRRSAGDDRAMGGLPARPKRVPIEIAQAPTEAYHRPGPIRRIGALVGSAGMVVVIGAVVATIVAFAVAVSITVLADLLEQ